MASAEDSGSSNAPGEHSLDYHPLVPLGAESKLFDFPAFICASDYPPGA